MGVKFNKKQFDKLVELCKEFFPEYKNWRQDYYFRDGAGDIKYTGILHCDKNVNSYKHCISIHFFELCLTELPKRIWNKLDENQVDEYLSGDYEYPWDYSPDEFNLQLLAKHPVDFLYNFVKECKRNKYFKK